MSYYGKGVKTVMLKGNIYKKPEEFIELTKEQLRGLEILGLNVCMYARMENGYDAYIVYKDFGKEYFAVRNRAI